MTGLAEFNSDDTAERLQVSNLVTGPKHKSSSKHLTASCVQRLCLKAFLVIEISAVGIWLCYEVYYSPKEVFMRGMPAPVLVFLSCTKTAALTTK